MLSTNCQGVASSVNFILYASGWQGTAIPYTQVITINGLTANGYFASAPSQTVEQTQAEQAAQLRMMSQSSTSITVGAIGEKPTINIPMQITLLG